MKKKDNLLVFLLLLLSSCGTPVNIPTEQDNIMELSTSTLISNQSPEPTRTPTPTASATKNSPLATREALIDNFADRCERPALESISTSPNGQWITFNCLTDYGYSIKIISADELKEWELFYFDLYGEKHDSLEGHIYVEEWSKDNTYAYIATRPQIDGPSFAFLEASALYRLNLDSGQLSETLSDGYYSVGFSPDEKRLAYFDLDPLHFSLIVRDMDTGNNEIIDLDPKYDYGGDLLWSNDSQQIIFSVAQQNTNGDYLASILLLDMDKKMIMILVDNSDVFLEPVAWLSEAKVVLESRFTAITYKFELELTNNSLTQITP